MPFSSDPAIRMLELLDRRLHHGSTEERATAAARFARRMGAGRRPLPLSRVVRFLRERVDKESNYLPRATAAVLALETKSAEELTHVARHFSSEEWCAHILGKALIHPHALIRKHARQALDANFSAKPIQNELIGYLSHPRREVRRVAGHLLQENCCAVLPADLALHQRLIQEEVPEVRMLALQSLGKTLEKAIAPIREALKDGHSIVRGSAAVALSHIATATGESLLDLAGLLRKTKWERGCAGHALQEPVRARPQVLRALVRAVGTSDWWASRCAAQALFGANRALDDHRSILLPLTSHPLPFVRSHAVGLLRLFVYNRERTVPLLARALDDSDADVRWAAVRGLGWMRSSAQALREPLERRRKRAVFEKKVTYSLALEELGVQPADLVALLIRGMTVPELRLNCITSLRGLGPRANAAIPGLRRAVKNPDLNVSTFARSALESIERR